MATANMWTAVPTAPELLERRSEVRVPLRLAGRYSLANRWNTVSGERRVFACRTINISPSAMSLAAPVLGAVGERVITFFDEFGKLDGTIARVGPNGFLIGIAATDEVRAKLTAKLAWLEKRSGDDLIDGRRQKRIVPKSPHSTLTLADGTRCGCFVIDMSVSGAAVSADWEPEIGMPLAVGKVIGQVVRRFAEGFAVHFLELQDPSLLETQLIRP